MKQQEIKQTIARGKAVLGIEMGSTRMKAVLIAPDHTVLAAGEHPWENRYENGVWTYPLEAVWSGLQDCYARLKADVATRYGITVTQIAALGVSGMMHGYLAFDAAGTLLAPFRTWRNTTTEPAAKALTALFGFNVPQRWSVAHFYQAMLQGEAHVPKVDFLTTLAGYVHWKLTGEKVLGVGEASGMFPIDSTLCTYDNTMLEKFDAVAKKKGVTKPLGALLPAVLVAGQGAGTLTAQGAALLDETGALQAGALLCPPEGDAGTGMVATNSITPRTGNVSAGTSVFAMVVLEQALSKMYPEIDMVTTPAGAPVAMVHCNTCTSDLDAWVSLMAETVSAFGTEVDKGALYETLYRKALEGDADCGGLLAFNYYSGEPITQTEAGRPLFVRMPDSHFHLANFMRAHLYSAMATLKIGMDLLTEQEKVQLERLLGHGGLFKTAGVAQTLMAGALDVPVAVMETAGEGGAWGVALLAAYTVQHRQGESLECYLNGRVFSKDAGVCVAPNPADVQGFAAFLQRYKAGIAIEQAAIANLR